MFCKIDALQYFIYDAPHVSEPSANIAPYTASDDTKPDGMRKARFTGTWDDAAGEWIGGSWVDEEAAQLEADLAAQTLSNIEAAIDRHITATAQAKGYNSTESCLSYIGDANPQWDAEAAAFKAWRSQCWEYVIAEQAKIDAGTRAVPTPEEAVAEIELLYPMVWP